MSLESFLTKKKSPIVVYFELTHRCSFLCQHCYIPESLRWPEGSLKKKPLGLDTETVKRVTDELAQEGTVFLVLTGGEIFLRPDIEEIIEWTCKRGFAVKLYTNGFHITPRLADRIKELGVYAIEMSLYGATEETYHEITRVRGGLKRALETLSLLSDRGIRTTVKCPIMKQNVDEIPDMKALAEQFGFPFRYDLVIIPRFDGDKTPLKYSLSDQEIRTLFHRLGARLNTRQGDEAKPSTCSVGRWSAVISPEGEVFPCIEMRQPIGNVVQTPFGDIWKNNAHMQRIRQKLDAAPPRAEFADGLCGHCPAFSLHSKGDMNSPSDEHQRLARIKREFAHPPNET